jgi:hypothetical protein
VNPRIRVFAVPGDGEVAVPRGVNPRIRVFAIPGAGEVAVSGSASVPAPWITVVRAPLLGTWHADAR